MNEENSAISFYRSNGNPDLVMKAYHDTLLLWKVPVQSQYVSTSFGLIHVLVAGPEDAEPLVLLHGFAFSSTMWLENINALSSRYRVYAFDFPGDINKSSSIRPIKNKSDCVAWFTEMLDVLGIDKAHVCGHSYGGYVAMVVATYVSDRIRKAIFLSPGAGIKRQNKSFFIRCLLAGMMPTTERIQQLMGYMTGKGNVINQTLKDQFTIAMQNALPRTKLFVSYIKDKELQQITVPVLLLIGDQDIQYDVEQAMERARRVIHDIEAIVIPETGHGLPLEKPEIVNAYMLDFLGRIEKYPA